MATNSSETTSTGSDRSGITMYGADWCGDCLRAKRFFAENEVAYDYINLEETPEAADIVLERNNGLKRIPVIVFSDDSHLTEPSDEALAAKLAALGDASTPTEPTFEVVENADKERFELQRDGALVGFASYRQQNDAVVVPHVETFPEHRGQGYAARLMEGMLAILRSDGRTITPLCPFAAGHVRDHPEHHDLLT